MTSPRDLDSKCGKCISKTGKDHTHTHLLTYTLCSYTLTHTHIYLHICLFTHLHVYTRTHSYTHTLIHSYTQLQPRIRSVTHSHMYSHSHSLTHTLINSVIHSHTQLLCQHLPTRKLVSYTLEQTLVRVRVEAGCTPGHIWLCVTRTKGWSASWFLSPSWSLLSPSAQW